MRARHWHARDYSIWAAVVRTAGPSINVRLFSRKLPMHRLVFKSISRETRLRIVEYGPWHPSKLDAEQWHDYFVQQLPYQVITIQMMDATLVVGPRAIEI